MSASRPGTLVDLWEGGKLLSGVVIGEEKGRLRIVTEEGREVRVTASRLAHVAGPSGAAIADAAKAAARHAERAREMAAGVEVEPLWELLVEEGGRHEPERLAGLALGSSSAEAASAMIRLLFEAKTYFERKGDLWEARSRDAVEQSLRRRRVEEDKVRRRASFLARARRFLEADAAPEGVWNEEDAPYLGKLIDLAVNGDESVARKEAAELLSDIGVPAGAGGTGALDLLVRAGLFAPDENLEIRRLGLRTAFPDDVVAAAEAAATRALPAGLRDLTGLAAFTVDDAETVEIDDALTWEDRGAGAGVVGIHIADPSCFVLPGDEVDAEALKRAATYYFPDSRLPMIPAAISERAASLVPGADRPVLSFLVTMGAEGKAEGFEIVPALIRSRARLTYEEADRVIAGEEEGGEPGDALRALRGLAVRFEEERAGAGAVIIRAPELTVKVGSGGVQLKRIDERGPSRRLVAEFMILANTLAAELCSENRIPAIYRKQAPPEQPPETVPDGPYDPVATRRIRRAMRRGEVSLAPGGHHALGVAAYTQITSPLRRYQDLAMQRQVKAWLSGTTLPYEAQEIARIAATTEEAERAARQAEAGAKTYWLLKFLAGKIGEVVEGVVVEAEHRRTLVELCETLRVVTIAPRPDHAPGQLVRLVVETVRPREGLLHLRELA